MKPSFDTWTVIFLFAAVQGLFVSTVLLFKKDKHPARKVLAVITLLFSLTLIQYTSYWTRYDYEFPYLMGWPPCFIFLFGPLFYSYFRLVFIKGHSIKKDKWHFLVFLIVVIIMSPLLFASVKWKQDLILQKNTPEPTYTFLMSWAGILHMVIYLVIIYKDNYNLSRTAAEVSKWFNWLTGFFSAFIAAYLSYFILVRFEFFNPDWDYAISFAMMFFIYFLAWFGYMQPKVFSGFDLFEAGSKTNTEPEVEIKKYRNSPVSEDLSLEIAENLSRLMLSQNLYRQSDISLDKLAVQCNTGKHYLSQVINSVMGMNFFEYINNLRIEEAKTLLLKPKDELNIIEVAYMVGYNNKVSFNKAFKNLTGLTPGEYRSKYSEKPVPEAVDE